MRSSNYVHMESNDLKSQCERKGVPWPFQVPGPARVGQALSGLCSAPDQAQGCSPGQGALALSAVFWESAGLHAEGGQVSC